MSSRSEARTRHESHAIVQIRVFGGLFMYGDMQSPGRFAPFSIEPFRDLALEIYSSCKRLTRGSDWPLR